MHLPEHENGNRHRRASLKETIVACTTDQFSPTSSWAHSGNLLTPNPPQVRLCYFRTARSFSQPPQTHSHRKHAIATLPPQRHSALVSEQEARLGEEAGTSAHHCNENSSVGPGVRPPQHREPLTARRGTSLRLTRDRFAQIYAPGGGKTPIGMQPRQINNHCEYSAGSDERHEQKTPTENRIG